MDVEIYKMSQESNWEGIRPYVAKLIEGMEHRRKSESDRINSIMQRELNSNARLIR